MMYMSTNWFPFDAKTHVVASAVQRERVGRANPFRGQGELSAQLTEGFYFSNPFSSRYTAKSCATLFTSFRQFFKWSLVLNS